jgi:starch synthase (maltosyl-transferring)
VETATTDNSPTTAVSAETAAPETGTGNGEAGTSDGEAGAPDGVTVAANGNPPTANVSADGATTSPVNTRPVAAGSPATRRGPSRSKVEDGRKRVVIEGVSPEIDCGRFPIKRVIGEKVVVEVDMFTDGHDAISGIVLYRSENETEWSEAPLEPLVNDRWRGEFTVTQMGRYFYTVQGWVDDFKSWRRDFQKRVDAGQDVEIDLLIGARLIEQAIRRATDRNDKKMLRAYATALKGESDLSMKIQSVRTQLALAEEVWQMMMRYPERQFARTYDKELPITVDREKARFSTWYEMFPRSCSPEPGRHGTFKDCEARLQYVADMGFDVLYFPPIHPIGHNFRKGRNNATEAQPGDAGSPWAIGAEEGGHKAIHPELGTLEDFRHLIAAAKDYNIEIALDIAFQCSPDHPYVREHPEWFRQRPDGTIQYAENPPKKYQDIYPFDFETANWQGLWEELTSVVAYWCEQGVRIFRVDNPHTKAFAFWEYCIREIKREYPDALFLAEAFTRPKVMYNLAKLGFTQSYTYFAWRNTKWDLTQYFNELTQTEVAEYFGPNPWPNTPDILTEALQFGGRSNFMTRLVLAATLGATYGIYGPAYELYEHYAAKPGSEEYLDSEKYEIRHWDIHRPDSLRDYIGRVNWIRRENRALQSNRNLRFHQTDNEEIICYSKHTDDFSEVVLVVVNMDPHHVHGGWIEIPIEQWGLDPSRAYQVHDLIDDNRYLWHGSRSYVEIDPSKTPAHIFRVRRWVRTERDFDYYT